jgi:hypothetical protein
MPNETISPFSAPKSAKTPIIGLLVVFIILIAGLGALFYKTDFDFKNIRADVGAIRTELQALQTKLTTNDSQKIEVVKEADTTTDLLIGAAASKMKILYTAEGTNVSFAVPINWGPENYTIKKADWQPYTKISVKRIADGNIPDCETEFSIHEAGYKAENEDLLLSTETATIFGDEKNLCQVYLISSK